MNLQWDCKHDTYQSTAFAGKRLTDFFANYVKIRYSTMVETELVKKKKFIIHIAVDNSHINLIIITLILVVIRFQ